MKHIPGNAPHQEPEHLHSHKGTPAEPGGYEAPAVISTNTLAPEEMSRVANACTSYLSWKDKDTFEVP